ncbi:14480_t:CDS:2 [Entrophospora sp. SA101]|nr:14480_t:CDS:2 [Entrophospora sp. SA101]
MSYNSVVLDELLQQTACYGLPYGIFGISCWAFTIFSVALTYLDFPLFSPWRWCKPYKSQDPLLAVIISAMVLGPAIYTCVYCHGEWQVILLAVGQLTPWSFKMLNDGVRARKVIAGDNKVQDPHNINGRYIIIGKILTILLAAGGWAGIIGLSIMLVNTTKAVTDWIWILFAVGLTAFVTMCVAICIKRNVFIIIMAAYISANLHIIGSHIILAMVSGNWSGIAPAGAGLISSIIFFAGKRLLFFDFECNF